MGNDILKLPLWIDETDLSCARGVSLGEMSILNTQAPKGYNSQHENVQWLLQNFNYPQQPHCFSNLYFFQKDIPRSYFRFKWSFLQQILVKTALYSSIRKETKSQKSL